MPNIWRSEHEEASHVRAEVWIGEFIGQCFLEEAAWFWREELEGQSGGLGLSGPSCRLAQFFWGRGDHLSRETLLWPRLGGVSPVSSYIDSFWSACVWSSGVWKSARIDRGHLHTLQPLRPWHSEVQCGPNQPRGWVQQFTLLSDTRAWALWQKLPRWVGRPHLCFTFV